MKKADILAEYRKERRRVNQLFRRWSKRGYVLPEGLIPDTPKRVTQGSIRRLRKIDSNYFKQKAVGWVDRRTGEVLPVNLGLANERKLANERRARTARANAWAREHPGVAIPTATEVSLHNLYAYIDQDFGVWWQSDRAETLRRVLDNIVTRDGADVVAQRYRDNIDAVQEAIQRAIFESDPAKVLAAVNDFIQCLSGGQVEKGDMEAIEKVFEPTEEDEIIDWAEPI